MALKPHRYVLEYQNGFFMNSTASRGGVVVSATGTPGSGAAMDNANQYCEYATLPSGRYPLGVLLNDFVNKDLTDNPLNAYLDEKQIGDKAAICKKGEVVTNLLSGATSAIIPGQPAYLGANGTIASSGNPVQCPVVGRWMSRPDQDGYAKIDIDL